jgi:selenocysteine lyase/cysteine desulfurase
VEGETVASAMETRGAFREEFAESREWVYFDHASTGYYPARTVRAIQAFAAASADPIGYDGASNERLREETRGQVAQLTGSKPELVAFTSSLAEAMNLFANGIDWKPGDNVVVPAGEFPSITYTFVNIRQRYGVELRRAPSDEAGRTDVERIIALLDERTRAVAISHVEWADGYRNDIATLGAACRKHGIELFVDATQSMGAQPIDLPAWGASAVAAHAYKWLLAGHGLGVVAFAEDAIERIYPAYAGVHSFELEMDDTSYGYDETGRQFRFKPGALRYQTGGFDKLSTTALNASLSLVLEADPERSSAHGARLVEQLAEGAEARGYRVASDLSPAHRSQYLAITTGSVEGDRAVVEQLAGRRVKVTLRPKGVRVAPYFYHDESDVERFLEALPEPGGD